MKRYNQLPDKLRAEVAKVLNFIAAHAPSGQHDLLKIRLAISANSPMIAKRFELLIDNSGILHTQITESQKLWLGRVLVDLKKAVKD